MDPLSISAGVAGFLSLAIEISKILTAYVGSVKSAPEEAQQLLQEVSALCNVSEQLAQFLRNDEVKSKFESTSALVVTIDACHRKINDLFKKLKGLQVPSDNKVAGFIERLKWPLRKEDCQGTLLVIHRFTQTFQFSLTISNCELLAKTSTAVFESLEEKRKQVQATIDGLKAMQLPVEELSAASKKQSEIFDGIIAIIQTSADTQIKMWNSVQEIQGKMNGQEMENLIRWISPLKLPARHHDVQLKRLPNTGNWFLETETFKKWRDSDDGHKVLGCYGIPGAGKTLISSLVIDHLSSPFGDEKVCVVFAYCDYRDKKQQTTLNIVRGLLSQAIIKTNNVPKKLISTLLEKKQKQDNLNMEGALEALSELLRGFSKTFICIDALDECEEGNRWDLLRSLKGLMDLTPDSASSAHPLAVRLFISGRPPMEEYINTHPAIGPCSQYSLKLEASTADIAAYIKHKLDMDTKVSMDEEFKSQIVSEITATSQGMFLLPALQIESVLDKPTVRKRRQALKEMPRALHDAFGITIQRINDQKPDTSKQAMEVIKWVFLMEKKPTLKELQHALVVEPGDNTLDRENFVDEKFLLQSCLGLVIVDGSTATVRLVHKSLQNYLQDQYDKNLLFYEGHKEIMHILLTYLAFDYSKDLQHGIYDFSSYDLLEYATRNWVHHARKSEAENKSLDDTTISLLVSEIGSKKKSLFGIFLWYHYLLFRFPQREANFSDWIEEYVNHPNGAMFHRNLGGRINPCDAILESITFWLLESALRQAIRNEQEASNTDPEKRLSYNKDFSSTFTLAASYDVAYSCLVNVLMYNFRMNWETLDNKSVEQLLTAAAEYGRMEVLEIFLAKDEGAETINPKYCISSYRWRTLDNKSVEELLQLAVQMGNMELVKLLLAKDEDATTIKPIDHTTRTNSYRWGSLDHASFYSLLANVMSEGNRDIEKLLLTEDEGTETINRIDRAISRSITLRIACQFGRMDLVKFLLDEDGLEINCRRPETPGKMPLWYAVNLGNTDIVKLLLERGADPNLLNESNIWKG